MIPTLIGRIQVRLFALATIGLAWTVVITPFLWFDPPGPESAGLAFTLDEMGGSSALAQTYKLTLAALAITAIFGALVWEPIYHFLMQFRWEKDWPALFNLLQVLPEGLSTFLLLHVGALNPLSTEDGDPFVPVLAYLFLFFSTWIVVWLFVNGPIKIIFVRLRFRGGRII